MTTPTLPATFANVNILGRPKATEGDGSWACEDVAVLVLVAGFSNAWDAGPGNLRKGLGREAVGRTL